MRDWLIIAGTFLMTAALNASPFIINPYAFEGGATSYDFIESFDDATDYDNTAEISEVGTPDPNYTPALEGSESFEVSSGGDAFDVDLSDNSTGFSIYFQFEWSTWDAFAQLAAYRTTAPEVGSLLIETRASGNLQITNGSVTADANGVVPSSSTTYHVWLDYTMETGGGNDGTSAIYVSTTGTKPGTPSAEITTGTDDKTLARYRFGDAAGYVFDRAVINETATPIGDNP